jgi:tetratricopeptide (TPR) repeat protein
MWWGTPWAGLLVAGALLTPHPAFAENTHLAEGRRLFREVELDKAVAALQAALRSRRLSREEKLEAYLLLAKANRALGRPAEAAAALRSLLRIEPEFRLSPAREPPSLIELLEQVRRETASAPATPPVEIRHTPVRVGYAGLGVTIQAEILNLRPEHQARLYYRRIGQVRYQAMDLVRRTGAQYLATIPGTALEPQAEDYLMEYYLAVTDSLREEVARVGSDERPLSFRVVMLHRKPAPRAGWEEPTSWHRRHWWVWVVVGVVVLGGAVGAGVAAR